MNVGVPKRTPRVTYEESLIRQEAESKLDAMWEALNRIEEKLSTSNNQPNNDGYGDEKHQHAHESGEGNDASR